MECKLGRGLVIVLFLIALAWAQEGQPPSIPAKKLSKPPVIDGVIQPDEWGEAFKTTEFWFPVRQQPGEFPTTAYLGYDSHYIYVAFECEDPEPAKIRAQETKRGGAVESDDVVSFLVDPQNKRLEPYWFSVNPLGTQAETIPGGSTENIQWRGDWEAEARIHEKGWSAEMRIPIAILRYPRGQTRFGIALLRFIPRRDELYTFPNMGNFYDEKKHTEWTGLELPVSRRLPFFLPYTMVDFDRDNRESRSGLDMKYISDNGLTSLLTLRPDFRNIAADVARVDFSYTEKVLTETRPFFQEGSGFFPPRSIFYSVRVQDMNSAFKSFGTAGVWQYGVLGGEYADKRFAVGRLRYQIAPRAFIGVVGTLTRWAGSNEDLFGAETELSRVSGTGEWSLSAALYGLRGNDSGHYGRIRLERNAPERRISWSVGYEDISPQYQPRLAFVPEGGFRALTLSLFSFDRPAKGALLNWHGGIFAQSRALYGGGTLDQGATLFFVWTLRSYHAFSISLDYLRRPPNIDRTVSLGFEWNTLELYRHGELSVQFGEQNGGRSLDLFFQQVFTLLPRFRLGISAEHFHLDYPESRGLPDERLVQAIITLNYEISPERAFGGRYVGQGGRFGDFDLVSNFYLTYLQRVRRGVDLFIIWGLPNADRSQNRLAVKLLMPLEI